MVGFFIASIISIYSPRIGYIIVTDEVPLRRSGRSAETGSRELAFCDSVRKRDRRCVLTGSLANYSHVGRWMGFEACHVFPLVYKGKCKDLGFDTLFDSLIEESQGYYINSVRNGILLCPTIHTFFDAYEVTINVDV